MRDGGTRAGSDEAAPVAASAGRRVGTTEAVVVLIAATAYFCYFFQLWTSKAWTSGLGDWLDAYFGNVVLEHWYYSVLAFRDPASPPMFHPAEAMRYSHAVILYAPVYVAVRLFSHPFEANTLTHFLVMLGGAFSLHVFLRRIGLGPFEAFVVGASFSTSPNVVNGSIAVWGQRASVFLIPPILLLLLAAIQRPDGRMRLAMASLAGFLGALLFAQDYYTAILMVLAAGLVAASVLATAHGRNAALALVRGATPLAVAVQRIFPKRPARIWPVVAVLGVAAAAAVDIHPFDLTRISGVRISARDPSRLRWLALVAACWYVSRATLHALASGSAAGTRGDESSRRGRRRLAAAFAGGGVAGALVFLWLYLGPYLEFPTFPRAQLFEQLRQPNPATWTSAWKAVRDLMPNDSYRPFAVVLGLVLLLWRVPSATPRWVRTQGTWFAAISLVVFLLPLRFGDLSPWAALFGWLPGMSGVRDAKRVIFLYELAVALVAAMWLTQLRPGSTSRTVAVLVVAAITALSWNTFVLDYRRDERVFDQWVRAPLEIDPSCRSFFIKGASQTYMRRASHMWALYGVDATFIALQHSIPTLNGYSAFTPEGWDLANPQNSDYQAAVDRWIATRGIQNTCALDIDARTMTPYTPNPPG